MAILKCDVPSGEVLNRIVILKLLGPDKKVNLVLRGKVSVRHIFVTNYFFTIDGVKYENYY